MLHGGTVIAKLRCTELTHILENTTNKLKEEIKRTEKKFREAVVAGKGFYVKKEILQRLRALVNQLKELQYRAES